MKILKVEIVNFQVIGNANIDLNDRGLISIQGVNNDDSSATSNGAGKSSIANAISWGLFGVTSNNLPAEEVVNNVAKKNCKVEITIQDNDDVYIISRHRKDSSLGNSLFLNALTSDGLVDIGGGTNELTQSKIDQIIGCSKEVFVSSVYCGQEAMPDLPRMTDKELKIIVEEAAGIDRLEKAFEQATIRLKAKQESLSSCMMSIEKEMGLLNASNEAIKEIDEQIAEAEMVRGERLVNLKNMKTHALKDMFKIEQAIMKESSSPLGALKERLSIAEEQIDRDNEKVTRLERKKETLLDEKNKAREEELRAKMLVEKKDDQIKELKWHVEDLENKVGKDCMECGKEYHEEDIELAKNTAIEKIKNLVDKKLTLEKSLAQCIDIRSEYEEKIAKHTEAIARLKKKVSDEIGIAKEIKSKLDITSSLSREQEKIKQSVEDITKKISDLEEGFEVKSLQELRTKRHSSSVAIEARIKEWNERRKLREKEHEIAKSVCDVFGRSGVRAHILDTVTPFLNSKTADYISTLTDGNIAVNWSTITATAKGDLREKFSIMVEKLNGAKSFKGLSGGEKRKVRLATALALRDLVASRASKPIKFQFLDEIDDALDSAGIERLMTILEQKGKEIGTIVIISHNSLDEYCDSGYVVVNNGGVSEVISR